MQEGTGLVIDAWTLEGGQCWSKQYTAPLSATLVSSEVPELCASSQQVVPPSPGISWGPQQWPRILSGAFHHEQLRTSLARDFKGQFKEKVLLLLRNSKEWRDGGVLAATCL